MWNQSAQQEFLNVINQLQVIIYLRVIKKIKKNQDLICTSIIDDLYLQNVFKKEKESGKYIYCIANKCIQLLYYLH